MDNETWNKLYLTFLKVIGDETQAREALIYVMNMVEEL